MSDARDRQEERLPIEPLDADAWARIGAGVQAKLDAGDGGRVVDLDSRRPAARTWAAAAAMVTAAAALVALLSGERTPAGESTGEPQRVVSGEIATEARAGDAHVSLEAHTALTVSGDEQRGYRVQMERGQAAFSVPKRGERPPFRVQAADVTVEVVGTQFSVGLAEDGVRVAVREGTVRVEHRGDPRLLHAGDAFHSAHRGEASESPRGDVPRPALEPRGSARPAPPRPPAAPMPEQSAASAEQTQNADAVETHRSPARSPRRATQERRVRPVEEPSPQARFEAASALEVREPQQALRAYRELAAGHGPWAQNALFAAARLELELEHGRSARSLLRRYLRRYPHGPNAADARRLLEKSP